MLQPNFFPRRKKAQSQIAEQVVMRALGDFQARGKVLVGRELPLDRLRGALRRAAEAFDVEEITDEQVVATLEALGANVRQVPSFVAKHPYRITVETELAERGSQVFRESISRTESQSGSR